MKHQLDYASSPSRPPKKPMENRRGFVRGFAFSLFWHGLAGLSWMFDLSGQATGRGTMYIDALYWFLVIYACLLAWMNRRLTQVDEFFIEQGFPLMALPFVLRTRNSL